MVRLSQIKFSPFKLRPEIKQSKYELPRASFFSLFLSISNNIFFFPSIIQFCKRDDSASIRTRRRPTALEKADWRMWSWRPPPPPPSLPDLLLLLLPLLLFEWNSSTRTTITGATMGATMGAPMRETGAKRS